MNKKQRMLEVFQTRPNKRIDVWTLIHLVKTVHHTEYIRQLRQEYTIENKTKKVGKELHSWYRFVTPEKPTLWEVFINLIKAK